MVLNWSDDTYSSGPVVRLSPNLVDVQLLEITDQAWGTQNKNKLPWNKDPKFYQAARFGMSIDNVISFCSPQESKRLRKIIGLPFARKFLFDREHIFKKCIKKMLANINQLRAKQNNQVDILLEYKKYALDILTEFAFGGFFKVDSIESVVRLMDESHMANISDNVFPRLSALLIRIPWKKLDWIRSTKNLINICDRTIREYKARTTPSGKDSVGQLLTMKDDDGNMIDHDQIVSSSLIMLFAGVETVVSAMTYATYALGRDPVLLSEISQELSAYKNIDSLDFTAIQKLPLLDSFIREVLRFWPPAPYPLPRVVPKEGLAIGNYFIPGGVCVSCTAYSASRNEEVFPEPETFNPKRWIGLTGPKDAKMWDQTMIFSYGPRICLGREMALIELRIFVAAMALNYTWTGVPDTPGKWDDEMTTFESAVIQPRRGKCVIDIKAKNPSI